MGFVRTAAWETQIEEALELSKWGTIIKARSTRLQLVI